jgi:hypothetical protein
MKHIVVYVLEKVAIVLFVLFLPAGAGVGYVVGDIGGEIGGYDGGAISGAIVGLIVSFLLAVLAFGIIFVLLEMNESLRAIRQQMEGGRKL